MTSWRYCNAHGIVYSFTLFTATPKSHTCSCIPGSQYRNGGSCQQLACRSSVSDKVRTMHQQAPMRAGLCDSPCGSPELVFMLATPPGHVWITHRSQHATFSLQMLRHATALTATPATCERLEVWRLALHSHHGQGRCGNPPPPILVAPQLMC